MNTLPAAEIVEFVRLGQSVSTNFTVTLPSREVFDAVMAAVERVNSFDPREVAQTIGSLFDNAMRVTFGAEGSPVLYIEVPFFTHQRITASTGFGDRYSDDQRRDFARQVISWARAMRADEIFVEQYPETSGCVVEGEPGEHPHRIRIWWD